MGVVAVLLGGLVIMFVVIIGVYYAYGLLDYAVEKIMGVFG